MSSEKGKEQNSVTNSAAQTLVFKNCGPAYNGSITIYQTLCNKHQECRNKTHMMETESTEEKTGKPLNTVDRTAANEMTSPEILNSPAEVVTNGKDDGTKANEAKVAVDKKDSTRKTIEEELKSRIMDALKTIETLREELEMDQFQQPTGFENNSIDLVICCEMEVKTLEKLYQSKMDEQKSMFEDMNKLKRRLDSNVLIQIETKKLITKSLKYKLMRMKQQMEKMLVKRQSNLKNIQKNLMKWMNLDLTVKNHIEKDADLMKFVSGNLESDDFIFSKKIEKSLISSHEMMKSLKDGGFERPSSISSTRPGALVSPMDFVIPPRIDFDSNSPNSTIPPNEVLPLQLPDAVPSATDSMKQIPEQLTTKPLNSLVPGQSENVEDENRRVRNTKRRRNIAPVRNLEAEKEQLKGSKMSRKEMTEGHKDEEKKKAKQSDSDLLHTVRIKGQREDDSLEPIQKRADKKNNGDEEGSEKKDNTSEEEIEQCRKDDVSGNSILGISTKTPKPQILTTVHKPDDKLPPLRLTQRQFFNVVNVLKKENPSDEFEWIERKGRENEFTPRHITSKVLDLDLNQIRLIQTFTVDSEEEIKKVKNLIKERSWIHCFQLKNIKGGFTFICEQINPDNIVLRIILATKAACNRETESDNDELERRMLSSEAIKDALKTRLVRHSVRQSFGATGKFSLDVLCFENHIPLEKWREDEIRKFLATGRHEQLPQEDQDSEDDDHINRFFNYEF